jgi:hypothetical protein
MTTDMNVQALKPSANLVEEWLTFCRRRGRKVFPHWPAADIRAWLIWHAEKGWLFCLRQRGRIVALGAIRLDAENAVKCTIEKVITTRPGGLAALIKEFQSRFPHWREWELWRHCEHDKFRRVSARWLDKIETLTN